MNKGIAKEWCDALRSGEYKQCGLSLNRGGRYCCLGVLCEIAKKKDVIEDYAGDADFLPSEVLKWAGLKTINGATSTTSLTELNDIIRFDFNEIADFIEEHAEEL